MQLHTDPDVLTFDEELDLEHYRAGNVDLALMTDAQLIQHYDAHGRSEGRQGNRLRTRQDFIGLIPAWARCLEIGPFCAPLLQGSNVKFFDVLDREGLERRAEEVQYPTRGAPFIDFVSPIGDLSIVNETFDIVFSCHCIEHQPDLIDHIQKVSRILAASGRYFIILPDKRYCFDALLPESNLADIVCAHYENRTVHSLRNVIEHRALTTHNDCVQHWAGQHGDQGQDVSKRVLHAVQEFERSNGGYIDVHAWQFTPASMVEILPLLSRLGYLDMQIERIYPTRCNSNEFWCILRKY